MERFGSYEAPMSAPNMSGDAEDPTWLHSQVTNVIRSLALDMNGCSSTSSTPRRRADAYSLNLQLEGLLALPKERLAEALLHLDRIVGSSAQTPGGISDSTPASTRHRLSSSAFQQASPNRDGHPRDASNSLGGSHMLTAPTANAMWGTSSGSFDATYRQPTLLTNELVKTEDDDGFKKINHYMVLKELGRGSFGKVKLAADTNRNDKFVAIKVIPRNVITKRFQQEQRRKSVSGTPTTTGIGSGNKTTEIDINALQEVAVMKKLKHPNVVRLLEVIDDPEKNKVCFVMQYIDRGRLLEFDSEHRCKAIDFTVAVEYIKQLVGALSYMHNRNIVHRDIKPENILLSMRGRVYLSDFGMSSVLSPAENEVNSFEGTPLFMAPEVLRGGNDYESKAADIWALGVTMYSMIYGELPWKANSAAELLEEIEESPIEDVIAEKAAARMNSTARPGQRNHNGPGTPLAQHRRTNSIFMEGSALIPSGSVPLSPSRSGNGGSMSPKNRSGSLNDDDPDFADDDPSLWFGTNDAQLDLLNELIVGMLHPDPVFRWNVKQCAHAPIIKGVQNGRPRRTRSLSGFSVSERRQSSGMASPLSRRSLVLSPSADRQRDADTREGESSSPVPQLNHRESSASDPQTFSEFVWPPADYPSGASSPATTTLSARRRESVLTISTPTNFSNVNCNGSPMAGRSRRQSVHFGEEDGIEVSSPPVAAPGQLGMSRGSLSLGCDHAGPVPQISIRTCEDEESAEEVMCRLSMVRPHLRRSESNSVDGR